jgi:hypothetical protein
MYEIRFAAMEDNFKIRSYGYSELAQLYFPSISKKSASNQFRKWIKFNQKLQRELNSTGFNPGQKILTPKQVEIMIRIIGEP